MKFWNLHRTQILYSGSLKKKKIHLIAQRYEQLRKRSALIPSNSLLPLTAMDFFTPYFQDKGFQRIKFYDSSDPEGKHTFQTNTMNNKPHAVWSKTTYRKLRLFPNSEVLLSVHFFHSYNTINEIKIIEHSACILQVFHYNTECAMS